MANDAATVQYFAYDNAILKRNNAELSQPDFTFRNLVAGQYRLHKCQC